ncbi:MAG: CDP-diacylglycerol--serine O-phosphatidyltransferase [Archaeoglobales archaeon]|nr:CDP-diacylglycerol--serine O-phosphatidyltransferase [Archaeoglobales archaeon]
MKTLKIVGLADLFSILNALVGFSGITYTMLYDFDYQVYKLLCFAAILDGIDGFVAKKTKKSLIGKQIDSFADSISFGLLPAVAMVNYSSTLFPLASLLVAFSILRLARFNMESFEDFYGLPTLPNALLICGLVLLKFDILYLATISFLTSFLMISDIIYPRIKKNPLLFFSGLIILLSALVEKLSFLAPLAASVYVIYTPARLTICRLKGQLSKQE